MREVYELSPCSEFNHHSRAQALVAAAERHRPRLRSWGLLLLMCCAAFGLQAQEICNNGIDDDNDGYVDCYDVDCSGSFFCANQLFGGAVPACQFTPPPVPVFQMSLLWATDSIAQPLAARRSPVIGDIDLDGVPEVITGAPGIANGTYVYNGSNGVLERTIAASPAALNMNSYAIADIDNDGFGEIVMVAQNAVGRQLLCYEHNGSLKWASSTPVGYAANDESWTPLIADFDESGVPEIYLGDQIYSSTTGALLNWCIAQFRRPGQSERRPSLYH
jgi:hypothetical protein